MDPFVVMEDADVSLAAEMAVQARLNNAGQVCIAPKRFIIPERLMEEFSAKCVKGVSMAKLGDPLSPETTLGPISSEPILRTVEGLIQQSIQHGDQLLTGGKVDPKHGYFFLHSKFIKRIFPSNCDQTQRS
jgi:succinate-semialdehyde dehydrogenase/glutarate-semialdehyde dehydrogenase